MSGNAADRGKVVEHRQYDSFGKILARTANLSPGAATLPGSGVGVAFGYTGRPIDEKTGLSDYRARWYDANTGRFINEDPSGFKGGDTNLFRYVGNDPLDRVDPSGLTAKWAGYGGKGSVPAAGWGAYGAGTLVTSGASNSTPTPFVMARAKSSPSFESPFLSGTKAFFGSISDSIVGGVTGLVTGEAGRQLGERAFQITVNNNGGKFNGQWGQVAYNIAGQMAGTHAMAEGAVGIDLASHEAVAAEDRVGRFVGGLGQFAGIAAGGAVMTRSAFGASAFTNLPGSAAVSRLSSSLNSAAARAWSRVDDWAGVGKNAGPSQINSIDKSWKLKIEGTAQQTGTPGHQFRTYREAIAEAKRPNVQSVHLDHGYNRGLDLEPTTIRPNRRPDVLSLYDDGSVARIEVQSRTDIPSVLRSRNAVLDVQLRAQGFTPLPPRVVRPTFSRNN